MFKKIIYATDGSPDSQEALEYAKQLAVQNEAEVVIVHAFQPVSSIWGDAVQEDQISRRIMEGEKVTEKALKELEEAGVDTKVEILEGPPADAILRVVDARKPDLIVMGTRGRSEPTSLLLGSVSHRVLAHNPVPVLVIKSER